MAAAVPEVPDGVPKLKAMSRERGPRCCARDTRRTPLFNPARKPPPDQGVPPLFWPGRSGRNEGGEGTPPARPASGGLAASRGGELHSPAEMQGSLL